jgi:hypothetical protein
MAESKSAEYASKIKEPSEFSSSVHPLTALAKFQRSECRPQPWVIMEQARALAFQRYLKRGFMARSEGGRI